MSSRSSRSRRRRPGPSRTGRLRRASALLVAAGCLFGVVPAAASSSPGVGDARDDLRQARTELHTLDLELSLAAQRIHEAKVLLATLHGELDTARERSERADARAADAAASFDAMVRWAYETGASSQLAVLGLGSLEELSQGVDLLSAMASNQERVAASADESRTEADAASVERASLEAAVQRTIDSQRVAGKDLEAAAGRQKELIGELEQRLHHRIQLAIADRRAADEAAQAAAAAEAARREAERSQPTPEPSPSEPDTGPTTGPDPGPTTGPEPLPGPSEPAPTTGEVVDLITRLWGTGYDGQVARCVAWRESRYQPTARNSSSGASGLFQLMPFWWDGNSEFGWRFDPYDAQANAYHAHLIWQAYGWEPWTTGHLCV